MSKLPEDLRRAIIVEVYRQAAELDWDGMTDRQRTEQYNRWLDDARIGGELSRYIHRDKIRYWLKDVPMKEYARARSGIGPLADLVSIRLPSPDQIAKQVMGEEWSAVESSVREKPLRCHIMSENETRLMIWGPPKSLRDLVWSGINAVIDGTEPSPLVVVASLHGHELDLGEVRRHLHIGKVAGLEVRHTTLRMWRVTPKLP